MQYKTNKHNAAVCVILSYSFHACLIIRSKWQSSSIDALTPA